MIHCDIVRLTMDSIIFCVVQCEAATVAAHMTHYLLSCVGLRPSTRPRSEPAHCVWDGKVGSRAQHRLTPACFHPTTHPVPVLLCFPPHNSHAVGL